MKIYNSIRELVGHTPLLRLHNLEKKFGLDTRLLVKLEYMNPAGSVKDRVAKSIIEDLEKKNLIKKGSVIIEPTSGNTGVGIAALAAAKGYRAVIIMPSTMSKERQMLIRAYGAEVRLTDGALGMAGAIAEAERMKAEIPGAVIAGQFINPMNPYAHRQTTAAEIYEDTEGKIDFFVAGVGTGGTITGVGEYLKDRLPEIKIVAVEPESSAVLSGDKAGSHGIQGIGAGFIPEVLNTEIIDTIEKVSDEDAKSFARLLGSVEGVAAGISSGAALCAAVRIAKSKEARGKTVVVLLPDGADRYLSTDLFE